MGVIPGTGLDIVSDTRRPQCALLVELFRLDQPLLTRLQLGQAPHQLLTGGLNDAVHGGVDLRALADLQRAGGVDKLVDKPLGLTHRTNQDHQGGRGTLLTRMAERGLIHIGHRQIRVRRRRHNDRILPGRFRIEHHLRLPGTEQSGRIGGAGQNHRIHILVRHQVLACLRLVGIDQLHQCGIHARTLERLVHGLDCHLGAPHHLRRRLDNHGGTGGQRREHATHGNGHREVPRRGHQHHLKRRELRPGHIQLSGRLGIIHGEVDGLGNFRIGLAHGLAGLVCHHINQIAPSISQLRGNAGQHLGALLAAQLRPSGALLLGGGHHLVNLGRVGHLRRLHLARILLKQLKRPITVLRQRRVGVRLAQEMPRHRAGLQPLVRGAILGAPGAGERIPPIPHRIQEVLLLILHGLGIVGEEGMEEVMLFPVFLQATHQVGDGHIEVFGVYHRGVQNQPTHYFVHGPGLGRRHALQHLHIQLVLHTTQLHELGCQGHREQVVRGDADAHIVGVLRLENVVHQPVVVGVHILLAQIRGLGPIMQLCLNPLHGQVSALHQANLNLRTALGAAFLGELGQFHQGVERVRQVGLQHNAGL